jgi:hypothetical protein
MVFTDVRQQIAIMNATSILGRILPGFFTRRYGIVNLYIFVSLCMGIMLYCLGIVKNTTGTAIFVSIYGIFPGAGKFFQLFQGTAVAYKCEI